MTDNQTPDTLPQRTPGDSQDHRPPATTQAPQTPNGWNDPWTRPTAWAAFGSNTEQPK